MRIVLLGSTGFVGKALLRQLSEIKDKDLKVKALIRKDGVKNNPLVEIVKGDLFNIPDQLWFDEPYVIVHYATKQIDYDKTGFEENNVNGTLNLIQSIKGPCLGIIYGSSMSVYGYGPLLSVQENTPPAPVTDLAKSRAKVEEIILSSMRTVNRWAFCLRPRLIIGKGDNFTMKSMITLARKGIKIGSGQQEFNVIDVDDYAKIIIDLSKTIFSNEKTVQQVPLNIGYRKPISFNEFISSVSEEIKVKWPRRTIPYNNSIIKFLKLLPFKSTEKLSTQMNLIGANHTGSVDNLYELVNGIKYEKDPVSLVKQALRVN